MARRRRKTLSGTERAGVRLVVLGMTVTDAAQVHGMTRQDMSKAVNSAEGKAYAEYLRTLCDQYTAALVALGMVPDDIIRPRRHRRPNPPKTAHPLRRDHAAKLRARIQGQTDDNRRGGES